MTEEEKRVVRAALERVERLAQALQRVVALEPDSRAAVPVSAPPRYDAGPDICTPTCNDLPMGSCHELTGEACPQTYVQPRDIATALTRMGRYVDGIVRYVSRLNHERV